MQRGSSIVRQNQHEEDGVFFILMEKVGSVGRYQVLTFLVLCVMAYMNGGMALMTPFLFYQDPYQCGSQLTGSSCLHYVCKLPPLSRGQYIPTPTIFSMGNKFGDFRCESEMVQMILIKSLMYGGALMAFISCFLIGNLVGGKSMMFTGLLINLVGIVKVLASNSLTGAGVGVILCFFGLVISHSVSFSFITETVGQSKRQRYKVLLVSCFSLGGFMNVIWYYAVPNFEHVLILFYMLPTILAVICFFLLFKDTPITLLTKRTPDEALQDLSTIAKINKKEDFDLTVDDIKELQIRYRQQFMRQGQQSKLDAFTVLDLFKFDSLKYLIIVFTVLDCVLNFQFFAPTMMLDQFNFSIFTNGLVVESAQLMACFLSYILIYRFERRTMAMISFGIITVCSLLLVFIWDQSGKGNNGFLSSLVVLIFIFVIYFAVSNEFNFYVIYLNEALPTQVRILGIGFTKTFGSLTAMATPTIINSCLSSGIPIMLIFGLSAAISILCSYILPQTLGKRPLEVIKELQQQRKASVKLKQLSQ